MFPEPGGAHRPACALRLDGCRVSPGAAAGSPQRLRIHIAQRGRELALLQVSNSRGTQGSLDRGDLLSPDPLPRARPVRTRRGKPG